MRKIQKIAIFTSIRSEYGVMIPLLTKIKNDSFLDLELLVGGAHLLSEHGNTINEIINDGFTISAKFPFLFSDSEGTVLTRSMGHLTLQMGEYLTENRPDIIIVVGDRFELLPVVNSALVLNIPIAHISGGDVTEGAIDNQIRHAVSKMAHLHFVGTESSKLNLLKMGEESWRVFNTGEPGIDSILAIESIPKEELYRELNLDVNKKLVITTFHPETISLTINSDFLTTLFERLLTEFPECEFLVTSSNFDNGGAEINDTFIDLAKKNKSIKFIKSLGQKRYYSILKYALLMLGNSSSGIIEAQSFNLPVVNVGDRQKGRDRNICTLDVEVDIDKIINKIHFASTDDFLKSIQSSINIYGNGNCSDKILEAIKTIDKEKLILKKSIF